jgi:hypothetical protein
MQGLEFQTSALPKRKRKKESKITILISDRADFRSRKVIKNKEDHYIIIKESIL